MKIDVRAFVLPAANGQSAALQVREFLDKWVQLHANGGTLTVQGTIDGVNWVAIGTAATTGQDSIVEVPQTLVSVRVDVSAYSAANSTATLGCRCARSD